VQKDINQGLLAAGLVVRAADTGRVLMLQRSLSENDPAAGYWEWPGGHLEGSESTWETAWREWQEETGCSVPDGEPAGTWTVGVYQGYVWEIPHEADLELNLQSGRTINPDDPDGDAIEVAAWFDPLDARDMPALRPECRLTDWNLVAGRIPALKDQTAGITAATGIVGVDLVGDDADDEDDDEEGDAEEVQKELRRWRDNARGRIKAGRKPRQFTSTVIPTRRAASIWDSLQNASSRSEVDAAFAVRKSTALALRASDVSDAVLAELGPEMSELREVKRSLETATQRMTGPAPESGYSEHLIRLRVPEPRIPEMRAPDVHVDVHVPELRVPDIYVHVDAPEMPVQKALPTPEIHVDVHVPEQKAPDVYVSVPEMKAPDVHVDVAAPSVEVHNEIKPEAKAKRTRIRHAADGSTVIERED